MYSAIAANKRKTWLIMGLFFALIALLGWLFSQYYGTPTIFWGSIVGAGLYTLFQYFVASRLALAVNGASEITKQDNPRLWRIVENLSITNGQPMPRVYIIDDPAPNAFATGRDPEHAHVAATSGILELMDDTELEGVMAHELSHIKNYDILVSTIAFGLTSFIGLIADLFLRIMWFGGSDNDDTPSNSVFLIAGIVAALLSPFVAMMIQFAVSRQREYLADATGVQTTRYPEGLARALEKLEGVSTSVRRQNSSTAHLYFANPLKKKSIAALFSTHPPLEDRVERLRHMGDRM